MQDRLCFVQFLHPGGEHGPDTPGFKGWTRGWHKRKYLRSTGSVFVDGHMHQGEIEFWGEWEAQSEVESIETPIVEGPHWIHRPFWSPPASYRDLQNTDPFVFGDRFHYTGCLQYTRYGPTQLRNLARGSVILFGSNRGRSNFVVDTVFVVADHVDHSLRDYKRTLDGVVSETYAAVTLAPWYASLVGCNTPDRDRSYRLYLGASVDNPIDGMFSFFPCWPASASTQGFARPSLRIPGVITPTMTQNKRLNPRQSIGAITPLWDEVVRQVMSQGLTLGIHADLPRNICADADAQDAGAVTRSRSGCPAARPR
ncbi:MAG: hypothetical protein H0V00_10515 [Chloroflexia bacterium]|nr:hypothetical protein [Chloroflexia bacterium]